MRRFGQVIRVRPERVEEYERLHAETWPGVLAGIRDWWKRTDAMQEPFPEREPGSWWLTVPEVFHTD